MKKISFDYNNTIGYIKEDNFKEMDSIVRDAHYKLNKDINYNGWLRWPSIIDYNEIKRIKDNASIIRNNSDVLVVIGIGGSYLGSKASIELFNDYFEDKKPLIIYAGNSLSASYLNRLIDFIKDKEVSINVISKSGDTTEITIAFSILRDFMESKYGRYASKRIYVTTGEKGTLRELAFKNKYETFTIPSNIGGRYSVLTAVGLLPMAVSNIDIDKVLKGANEAMNDYDNPDIMTNNCYQYAVSRNILYNNDKKIEALVNYEPKMYYLGEWWKQLFGESEGKDGKGIFPVTLTYSTDLHSLGQYVQDGERHLFETVLHLEEIDNDITLDNINDLLNGKRLSLVNNMAFKGVLTAHNNGGIPNLIINIPLLDEYYFGYLIYFFEKSCAISGYLLGVNPFDQPGVEAYKQHMLNNINESK